MKKYIEENGLLIIDDTDELVNAVRQVIADNPKVLEEYKAGKTKVLSFFVGQSMKILKGKADAGKLAEVIKEELDQ